MVQATAELSADYESTAELSAGCINQLRSTKVAEEAFVVEFTVRQ
jgi:hypothetical protein